MNLDFGVKVFKDQDLRALVNLKSLPYLALRNVRVSFDRGILPILEKFGRESLKVLHKVEHYEKLV